MSMELKNIVEKALESAKKYGAADAFVSMSKSLSVNATWRNKKVEKLSSSGASSLSVDLYVDGRYSAHSTSDLRPEAVEAFIRRGIDMTRLLEPDEYRGLADPASYEGRTTEDLKQFDPEVEKMTPDDLIAIAKDLEAAAAAHSEAPIQDISSSAKYGCSQVYAVSSNGFSGERNKTNVSNSVNIVLKDEDGKLPSDYGFSAGCRRADLLDAKTVADDAVRRAMSHLRQIKLPTKNRTVLLDNRVSGEFLAHFMEPIMGRAIDQKQSYFLDSIGKNFGSPLLTIVDMPHIPGAMSSRAYDGEGMATKDRILFEAGNLRAYCLSNYYARKLKLDVTSAMLTNIVMPEAKNGRPQADLIQDIEDGILITDTLGGNMDAVRGDFSYGIVGIAIEKGKLTTPVSEMNINGNFTTFWNRLSAIGNDVYLYSNFMTPTLRIDDVTLTGA